MINYHMRVTGDMVSLCNRLRISVFGLCRELKGWPAYLSAYYRATSVTRIKSAEVLPANDRKNAWL